MAHGAVGLHRGRLEHGLGDHFGFVVFGGGGNSGGGLVGDCDIVVVIALRGHNIGVLGSVHAVARGHRSEQ
jgi:hypothetical protein